jgi:hypothetical protein
LPAVSDSDSEEDVERWQKSHKRPDTVMETYRLFQQGLNLAQIADARELAESTIYTHLVRLIDEGKIELHQVISPELEAEILKAVEVVGSAASASPIKAVLPDSISYGQIRCVLAAHPELSSESFNPPEAETPERRVVRLGERGGPEAASELVAALNHENGNVRRLAASALGKIGDPQAVEPLLNLLQHEPHPQVRQYAINALGKLRDLRAQPLLEQIVANSNEPDYNIKSAQTALKMLLKGSAVSVDERVEPAPQPETQPAQPISPPSPADSAPSSAVLIVLDSVAKLGGTLGRTGLAQFLSGSQAAWLETFTKHSAYGQLSHFSQRAILDVIDALIAEGKLTTTQGLRPKLILPEQKLRTDPTEPEPTTEADSSVLGDRGQPPPEQPASTAASSSNYDPHLFELLRAWRSEQAKAHRLSPYIIFPNKVLEAIAAAYPTTLAELGLIPGVGPIKLEQYGQAIMVLVNEYLSGQGPQPSPAMLLERQSPTGQPQEPDPLAEELQAHDPIVRPADTEIVNRKSPGLPARAGKIQNPSEAILAVVSDLDGLLSLDSLAQLLTAGPEEIVSFSDHELFATFHGRLTAEDLAVQIQTMLETRQLVLGRGQRLTLP